MPEWLDGEKTAGAYREVYAHSGSGLVVCEQCGYSEMFDWYPVAEAAAEGHRCMPTAEHGACVFCSEPVRGDGDYCLACQGCDWCLTIVPQTYEDQIEWPEGPQGPAIVQRWAWSDDHWALREGD